MLKKHMAACLVVTAFAAAPAFAQTSPAAPSGGTDRPTASGSGSSTTGSSAMQPSGAAGSATMSQSTTSQGGAMQGQFMTQMQPNQIMASKLIGTRVVSSNNESIGDINDVIVDRNGQAIAAVVGVGGFLGIGEKDVAVPFNALEFASSQQANAGSGNNASAPATTGSTGSGNTNTAGNTSGSAGTMASDGPDRVILRMTKADLQGAPAFNTSGNNANSSSGASGGQSGTTTAPKP